MAYYNNNMGERLCANKELYVTTTNPRKQAMKDKQMQRKLKKFKINKIQTMVLLCVLVVSLAFAAFVIIAIQKAPKKQLTDSTIFTTLDVNKYQKEILDMYNRDGQKELFAKEMSRIQELIGSYIVENMTMSDDGLKNIIDDINEELKAKTWGNIVNNKSTYYIGDYSVDSKGNIKFRFGTKQIEPNWVNDESVSKYIILN